MFKAGWVGCLSYVKQEVEKVGNGECQLILKNRIYLFAETIMSSNLLPALAFTAGMTSSRHHAGRSNRFYRLSNQEQIHVCYTSMSRFKYS